MLVCTVQSRYCSSAKAYRVVCNNRKSTASASIRRIRGAATVNKATLLLRQYAPDSLQQQKKYHCSFGKRHPGCAAVNKIPLLLRQGVPGNLQQQKKYRYALAGAPAWNRNGPHGRYFMPISPLRIVTDRSALIWRISPPF